MLKSDGDIKLIVGSPPSVQIDEIDSSEKPKKKIYTPQRIT